MWFPRNQLSDSLALDSHSLGKMNGKVGPTMALSPPAHGERLFDRSEPQPARTTVCLQRSELAPGRLRDLGLPLCPGPFSASDQVPSFPTAIYGQG